MAQLNIAERRIIQDGKIVLKINESDYDFRISTIPTINGEKIVIRIYNSSFLSNEFTSEKLNEILKNKNQSLIDNMQRLVLEGQTTFNEFEELLETI